MKLKLVLATRKSQLALRQTELTIAHLSERCPDLSFEIQPMETTGDRQKAWSLENKGGKGLFTKELEVALLEERADLAVHSAKDMPTEGVPGLEIAGYLPRHNPADVLVMREDAKQVVEVATSSPRRRQQAKAFFPCCCWGEIRGNIETRLKKVMNGAADATILAKAGLDRLEIESYPGLKFKDFAVDKMVPAAGQGAIAIQCREAEVGWVRPLLCEQTFRAVTIERMMLSKLGGGCHTAVGVHFSDGKLLVFHEDFGMKSLKINGDSLDTAESKIEDFVEKELS